MRKNQPLVPRSNIAGSWARGGGGYQPTVVPLTATHGRLRAIDFDLPDTLIYLPSKKYIWC